MPNMDEVAANFVAEEAASRSGRLIFFAQIREIPASVSKLKWLRELRARDTKIQDLDPLAELPNLELIDIGITDVSSLNHITNLKEVRKLVCDRTNIKSLEPIRAWDKLEELDCSLCVIGGDAEFLASMPKLQRLYMTPGRDGTLGSVPRELLSDGDNCLERVKDYYDSLKDGSVQVNSVKLFVYGNGEVGKTQIARQLDPPEQGAAYDPTVATTHGIHVRHFMMKPEDDNVQPLAIRLWDFGGQDLYHGAQCTVST